PRWRQREGRRGDLTRHARWADADGGGVSVIREVATAAGVGQVRSAPRCQSPRGSCCQTGRFLAAMAGYEYVTPEQLAGFDKYKYSAVDSNPLSLYVMHPFWNTIVKPLTMSMFQIECGSWWVSSTSW
uniref:Uncharacterized protein n=1 Tax=Chelonoidis abingdonii TaxID=106734 RepID=A0A8C0J8X5_CHEAB